MKWVYIYKIFRADDKKAIYIGKSINPRSRMNSHRLALRDPLRFSNPEKSKRMIKWAKSGHDLHWKVIDAFPSALGKGIWSKQFNRYITIEMVETCWISICEMNGSDLLNKNISRKIKEEHQPNNIGEWLTILFLLKREFAPHPLPPDVPKIETEGVLINSKVANKWY